MLCAAATSVTSLGDRRRVSDAVASGRAADPEAGRDAVRRFFTAFHPHHPRFDRLVPVRANGQPAWGAYVRDAATGGARLGSIFVLTLAGDLVAEIVRFETTLAPYFGLPRTLD